jgi:predicted nucleic acid-binding protein
VFAKPTPLKDALVFIEALRERPNCVEITPLANLQRTLPSNRCNRQRDPDAYLAALAIESGSEWITTDTGFSRPEGLRFSHPLTYSQEKR